MSTTEKLTAERGAVYGHPFDDFSRVNEFAAVLDRHFKGHPALKHALYMVCVKMSRLCETPAHRDSVADGGGYFKTYDMALDRIEAMLKDQMTPPAPPVMRGASVAVGPSRAWIAPEDVPSIAGDLGSMPFAEAAQILTNRSSGDAP